MEKKLQKYGKEKTREYIDTYTNITPDELISIAHEMKKDNISSFKIDQEYDSLEINYYRFETEEESEQRIKEEKDAQAINKERAEFWFKKQAKDLGYKLIKE